MRELGADEFARNGKDQAGLNQVGWFQRWIVEKIGKRQAGDGVRKRRDRDLHTVASEIYPFQEVRDLVSADAEGDFKDLRIRHFLTHACIEARTALLDVAEVKAGYLRGSLPVVVSLEVGVGGPVEIVVVPGNGRNIVESDGLRKRRAEVWIGGAAVANEPAGVDVEMHQIGEARDP